MASAKFVFLALCITWSVRARAKSTIAPPSEGLDALERTVIHFPTLDAFLHDKAALKKYEAVLVKYFGREKFPCENFSDVVGQLRRWMKADPHVAERLWAKQSDWEHQVSWRGTTANAERFRWIRPARLFHGIWEDLSRSGCDGGPCGLPDLGALNRWATALEGADLFYLEKGGAFAGANIVVTELFHGPKRMRLVSFPADSFLTKYGKLQKKKKETRTTLLADWASEFASTEPLVIVDAKETVRSLGDGAPLGPTRDFAFRDSLSKKLAEIHPDRCEGKDVGRSLAGGDGMSAGGSGGGGSVGGGGSGGGAAAQGALGDIMRTLELTSATRGAKGKDGNGLEISLRNVLNNSGTNPNIRAQAALGLNLMKNAAVGNAAVPTFSPATQSALTNALQDPSPQVRGQSALALSGPGSSPVGGGRAGAGFGAGNYGGGGYGGGPLGNALREAFAAPRAAAVSGTTNINQFGSPEAVRDEAKNGMLRDGINVDPKTQEGLWNEAKNGETLQKKKDAVDGIADEYLKNIDAKSAAEAVQALTARLKTNPELYYPVINAIDQRVKSECTICNEFKCDKPTDNS